MNKLKIIKKIKYLSNGSAVLLTANYIQGDKIKRLVWSPELVTGLKGANPEEWRLWLILNNTENVYFFNSNYKQDQQLAKIYKSVKNVDNVTIDDLHGFSDSRAEWYINNNYSWINYNWEVLNFFDTLESMIKYIGSVFFNAYNAIKTDKNGNFYFNNQYLSDYYFEKQSAGFILMKKVIDN